MIVMLLSCDAFAHPFQTKPFYSFFASDIQSITSELNICQLLKLTLPRLHDQRPHPTVKPLNSYTAMKSAAAGTLDPRRGNTASWRRDRCFRIQIVLTRLPLHHMSCKVCETLREIAMIGLY